ncbi:MAG: type IV pilin [Haloarculaceae archaeon]
MGTLFGGFESDERGVSPVIGVVLVVAITVILAAVIGQAIFGFDFVRSPSSAPAVSFNGHYDEAHANLTLSHESGTDLQKAALNYTVSGGDGNWSKTPVYSDPADDEFTSGQTVTLEGIDPGETVRVLWTSQKNDQTYVLYTWKGPKA